MAPKKKNHTTKKQKKWTWKKPKGKPKRPLTSYNLFFREQRLSILQEIKESEGKKFDMLSKIIGARWRQISEFEKERLDQEAQVLLAVYNAELAIYQKSPLGQEEMRKQNIKKNEKRGKNRTTPNNSNTTLHGMIPTIVSTSNTSFSSDCSRSSSPLSLSTQSVPTRVTASEGSPRSILDSDTFDTASINTDITDNDIDMSSYLNDASCIVRDNCRRRMKDALSSQMIQIDGKRESDDSVDRTSNAVVNVSSNCSSNKKNYDDSSYTNAASFLGSNNSTLSLPNLFTSLSYSIGTTERLDGSIDDRLLYQPELTLLPLSFGKDGSNNLNSTNKHNRNIDYYQSAQTKNPISRDTFAMNATNPILRQDDNYHYTKYGCFPKIQPIDEEAISDTDWSLSDFE